MNKTKKFNPSYIVNLDDIETLDDIDLVFALSKHNGGNALTDDELYDIVEWSVEKARPTICIVECNCNCKSNKKLPWYKRFWNWITRKNK